MKKQYTKKQITEAIAYWQKQLKMMNESAQFNSYVQRVLDAFANMSPEKTNRLKELAAANNLGAPDELDDFIDEQFWDIDRVLDNIEDTDINNELHMNLQYDAMNIIKAAAAGDQAYARKISREFTDYLKRSCPGYEAAIQGWQSHVNEPAEVLMALYDILDEKFNLKNYSIDYTAWHMDKYTVDIQARSEDDAKKKFFKEYAHEEYDMKDFEITQIKEN